MNELETLRAKVAELEAKLAEANKLLECASSDGCDCPVHGPVVSNPCVWCRLEDAQQFDELVKHMVERFLSWKLPTDFAPDAGISFKADFNENTPYPSKHEPTGTNLFWYGQAEAMIRHMLSEVPRA